MKFKVEVNNIPNVTRRFVVARFTVDYNGKRVSVYLDWYSRLGYVNVPYYELYPFDGDIKRYYLNETEELMKDIEAILEGKDGDS